MRSIQFKANSTNTAHIKTKHISLSLCLYTQLTLPQLSYLVTINQQQWLLNLHHCPVAPTTPLPDLTPMATISTTKQCVHIFHVHITIKPQLSFHFLTYFMLFPKVQLKLQFFFNYFLNLRVFGMFHLKLKLSTCFI